MPQTHRAVHDDGDLRRCSTEAPRLPSAREQLSQILADLQRPHGLARQAALSELRHLAPLAALLLTELDDLVATAADGLFPFLLDARTEAHRILRREAA